MSEEQAGQSAEVEEIFDPVQHSRALVAELQERKLPLDKERSEIYGQIKQLKSNYETELATLREKLRAVNAKIVPIDKQLRNADGLKNLRGTLAEKVAGEIRNGMGDAG